MCFFSEFVKLSIHLHPVDEEWGFKGIFRIFIIFSMHEMLIPCGEKARYFKVIQLCCCYNTIQAYTVALTPSKPSYLLQL